MPFYILAIGLLVALVAALLIGGCALAIAGGVGSTLIARRARTGRRVPRGARGTSIAAIVLGVLMLAVGAAVIVLNVLIALDVVN